MAVSESNTAYSSIFQQEQLTHWDIHFYFNETSSTDIKSAAAIRKDFIKRFPSVRTFDLVERPVGPHPIGMWEAHLSTPSELGAAICWLSQHHSHHSVLIHPNSVRRFEKLVDNHGVEATWIGNPLSLNFKLLEQLQSHQNL